MQPLSQPPNDFGPRMVEWLRRLWLRINETGALGWVVIDKSGSNLADLETRNHEDLQNINTATYTHLSATDHADLTDGGNTTLHVHDQYILGTDIGVTVQAYDADIPTVSASQVEMEAGTEAALRSMSPLGVAQAIAALASGGGSTIIHKNLSPITTNQSLASGENGSITTPVTFDTGVTLTLATGSRLVFL